MRRSLHSRALLLLTAATLACGGDEPVPEGGPAPEGEAVQPGNFRGRVYERNFVFTTLTGDSAFVVPWLMTAQIRPGGVDRRARGYLARGATWEGFYDESWETPPSRTPWRIHPHSSLRLVVGEADAIQGVIYSQGARQLELDLTGGTLMEWTGTRGQVFRLFQGAAFLAEQRVAGLVLDMTRVHAADEAAQGDWAFLVSGDSLQMVLENPTAAPPGTPGACKAWARLDFRDLQWPTLTVEWAEVSSFPAARQDVPVSLAVSSEDGDLSGVLTVQSAELRAGAGEGPVLPVDALFLVGGTVVIEGRTYPMRGLFRHSRP